MTRVGPHHDSQRPHRGSARLRALACLLVAGALAPAGLAQDLGSLAAASEGFGEVPDYVEVRAFLDQDVYWAGQTARVAIEFRIDPSVHLNAHVPTHDYQVPTTLTWDQVPEGVTVSDIDWPPPVQRAFEFTDGEKIAVLEGVERAFFTVVIPEDAEEGAVRLRGTFRAQGCTHTTCYAPQTDRVRVTLLVVGRDEEPESINEGKFRREDRAPATGAPAEHGDDGMPPPAAGPAAMLGPDAEMVPEDCETVARKGEGGLGEKSLAGVFLFAFGAGLLLTLTPCVLPLVPITIGYFSRQQREGGRPVALAVLYVLGLAAVYSALGTVAALSGSLFGAALQNPFVLIAIAGVLVTLALSMFGILPDLQLPSALSSKIGRGRSGHLGAFGMGSAMGIVAAPCVGPFVVTLLTYVGQLGAEMPKLHAAMIGAAIFFVLALGLGMPFFLVGLGVASIRPGAWMVSVKKVFGFLILGVALWFLRPLTGNLVFEVGAVLLLIGLSVFLVRHAGEIQNGTAARAVRGLSAVAIVAAVVLAVTFLRGSDPSQFRPYSSEVMAEAREEGRPVMIDFSAEWCTVCKEMEHRLFPRPEVQEAFREQGFVLLQVDLTHSNAELEGLSDDLGCRGLPCVAFVDSRGEPVRDLLLSGWEEPEEFILRLRCVDTAHVATGI